MNADVELRWYRPEDLARFTRLFNEVNGDVGTERAYDTELMGHTLSPPLCYPEDDCRVAESSGEIVGFALLAPELPIGRAVATTGVIDSHRGRGIERRLLRAAEDRSRDLGARVLHVQVASDDRMALEDLSAEGFGEVRRFSSMVWQDDATPQQRLPEGCWVRPLRTAEDVAALTRLQNESFDSNWGFCPNTVEQIQARVRSKRCDPDGIVLVLEGDQIIAYNWTLRAANAATSTGWISMTGAHPGHRGRGLGTAAVVAGMEYLKSRGVDRIELEVDQANIHAVKMYRKLGFRSTASTLWYEKLL